MWKTRSYGQTHSELTHINDNKERKGTSMVNFLKKRVHQSTWELKRTNIHTKIQLGEYLFSLFINIFRRTKSKQFSYKIQLYYYKSPLFVLFFYLYAGGFFNAIFFNRFFCRHFFPTRIFFNRFFCRHLFPNRIFLPTGYYSLFLNIEIYSKIKLEVKCYERSYRGFW